MLQLLRKETEGKLPMLLPPRNNGLTSLFKEVSVFKGGANLFTFQGSLTCPCIPSLVVGLRGPVGILFISHDTCSCDICSDSMAKLFRACFCGVSHNYRAICCKKWVSHRCACVSLSAKGGIAPFWGSADLPEQVSRDIGYRSIVRYGTT